ncbi:MAG: hypothetical protein IJR15_06370 [Clostridiales bacterium]|nr:hypothetical protein [Clostridiales bacterium]
MRKTNKQSTRLADDKKGVILITILFIVAVALIFITTSLMISIAARQRVYSNAKSDQARLTVTSLAQSIWQAIYSQQLSDQELMGLAKGNTLVSFTSPDVPGMVAAAPGTTSTTQTTAYFYSMANDDAGNPTKIGIECKCSIDGETQYYTLVLKRNSGEGVPQPMFQMCVELGNPGMLNSFNFGVDASQIVFSNEKGWMKQQEYEAPDNIIFLRGTGVTSNRDGSGFYCRVLATGHIYLRDAVFTDDVYFVGEDAIFDFEGTSQTGTPLNTTDRGDIYFWGSNTPFIGNDAGTTMSTFRNVYFDYRALDAAGVSNRLNIDSTGFNNEGGTTYGNASNTPFLPGYNSEHPWGIAGSVSYETGTGTYLASAPSNWTHFNSGTDKVPDISSYLTVSDSVVDTTGEVVDTYGKSSDHPTAGEITTSTSSLTAGYYYIDGAAITHAVNCDVTGGDIIIYVKGSFTISNGGRFIISSADTAEHNVVFVLEGSSSISVNTSDKTAVTGFVDPRCFNGTDYLDVHKLNQTTTPRIYIFAAYTGGTALTLGDTATNGGVVCTAYLGFFPSTTRGSDGASLALHNVAAGTDSGGSGIIYYGRIAAGSLPNSTDAGGHLNVPYCPSIPGQIDYRNEAYRDNTDFSVVTEECGYFTA